MSATRWGGAASRKARAQWRPIVQAGDAICCRCGKPIHPEAQWQPDHWPIPRELGGTETAPAHARCNMSAGGKRGGQITQAKRAATRAVDRRLLRW